MFFVTDNIKIKNFYAVCDAAASLSNFTRNSLAKVTRLSYPTVSKTVENLLDMGILSEKLDTKSYTYRFNVKYYFAIADLRGGFRMSFTDFGATEMYSVTFKESDAFYYDEKLSLFFRNTSLLAKRRFPRGKLSGVCVILPSVEDVYRDTRGILSSKDRLRELILSYFSCTNIIIASGADAATDYCHDRRALVIMKEPSGIICKAIGYGCDNVSVLKSVSTAFLGKCSTVAELASELAFAVGNLCDVLSPDDIYIDGDRMFSASSFPRYFKNALARFNCTDETILPLIHHSNGSLAVAGGVRKLRCSYISEKVNENIGR